MKNTLAYYTVRFNFPLIFLMCVICYEQCVGRISGHKSLDLNNSRNGTLSNKQNSSKTIIGGRPARIGEAPYQLSLRLHGNHWCGAVFIKSPIGRHLALTAAHCVFNPNTGRLYERSWLTVTGGSIVFNDTDNSVQTRQVRRIQVHQAYNHTNEKNDIALLILDGFFWVNSVLSPIKLPSDTHEYTGNMIRVSGWGNVQQFPDVVVPKYLQIATLPIVDQQTCDHFHSPRPIFSSNICALYPGGSMTACYGDSGGPAVGDLSGTDMFATRSNQFLIGLVSWGGETCTDPLMPNVFTRVSSFNLWIRKEALYNDIFNLWIPQSH